jgi:hypothetical protein
MYFLDFRSFDRVWRRDFSLRQGRTSFFFLLVFGFSEPGTPIALRTQLLIVTSADLLDAFDVMRLWYDGLTSLCVVAAGDWRGIVQVTAHYLNPRMTM